MAKGVKGGADQSQRYHEHNPDQTTRQMKTPVYGTGKITHMAPDYPQPGSPANSGGHQHVNKGGKKGK